MKLRETADTISSPRLNVGSIFDIMTGRWVKGSRGENILTGGVAPFTGIGGPPNHFKSALAHYLNLIVTETYRHIDGVKNGEHYHGSTCTVYDTETTFEQERLEDLSLHMPWLHSAGIETLVEDGVVTVYKRLDYFGEDWWTDIKKAMKEKAADKKQRLTMPHATKSSKPKMMVKPDVVTMDSMTEFSIENIDKMMDENEIGDKSLNMEAMTEMRAKSQMVRQLPTKTSASGTYVIATAHVGVEHKLDQYAITPQTLLYLKGNAKFKRVPNQFNFLPNDVYYIYNMKTLKNASSKGPEFPTARGGDYVDSPELQEINVYNTRGKSGLTGFPFSLLVSQNEGILPSLTEFQFIKKAKKYGIGGNDQNYYLDLCPDVKLSRTTVRDKIDSDARLRKALHISAELCYMTQVGIGYDSELICTPKELYEDIKKLGYDWNELLDTRSYWLPLEWEEGHRPFLSTYDLLEMRANKYTPYWLGKKKGK